MMNDDENLLNAILCEDFASFLTKTSMEVSGGDRFRPSWHIEAIAWELDRIRRGNNTRLIVTMPPRYLKSIAISVARLAWMLGHKPQVRFVCVSYSGDLAAKHANDCRAVMQTEWYQRLFPKTRQQKGSMAEMDFASCKAVGDCPCRLVAHLPVGAVTLLSSTIQSNPMMHIPTPHERTCSPGTAIRSPPDPMTRSPVQSCW